MCSWSRDCVRVAEVRSERQCLESMNEEFVCAAAKVGVFCEVDVNRTFGDDEQNFPWALIVFQLDPRGSGATNTQEVQDNLRSLLCVESTGDGLLALWGQRVFGSCSCVPRVSLPMFEVKKLFCFPQENRASTGVTFLTCNWA